MAGNLLFAWYGLENKSVHFFRAFSSSTFLFYSISRTIYLYYSFKHLYYLKYIFLHCMRFCSWSWYLFFCTGHNDCWQFWKHPNHFHKKKNNVIKHPVCYVSRNMSSKTIKHYTHKRNFQPTHKVNRWQQSLLTYNTWCKILHHLRGRFRKFAWPTNF